MTRRPRGDLPFGPPAHSALNLRLVLAVFGVLLGVGAVVVTVVSGAPSWLIVACAAFALLAAVNAAVVQYRRRQRSRAEGGRRHSLFE